MKKIIKRILLFFIIIFVLQFVLFLFKKEHDVSYEVKSNDLVYKVDEVFKNDNYYFKVKVDNKYFVFDIDNEFNKKKKVLDDIYYYKNNDVSCIYPDVSDGDIICLKDNVLLSYYESSLYINDFVSMLKKKGFYNTNWDKKDSVIKKIGQASVDVSNILDDTYIYVWKYNGFYSINNEKLKQINVFNSDTYVNDLGVLVDKYYLVPNYDSKYDFKSIYVYNVVNDKKKEIKLKNSISRDSYINGVVDNKVYLTDIDDLIQYEINPKKRKVNEVGNTIDGALYYDGEFSNVNMYEYRKSKVYFEKEYDIEEIIGLKSIVYSNKISDIYYYVKDNCFYKYNSVFKTNLLLFKSKMNDISMVGDVIYFINDNNLYMFDGKLKVVLTYDELSFNSTNRYAVYKK